MCVAIAPLVTSKQDKFSDSARDFVAEPQRPIPARRRRGYTTNTIGMSTPAEMIDRFVEARLAQFVVAPIADVRSTHHSVGLSRQLALYASPPGWRPSRGKHVR
jgi:hypothetical protein